MEINISFDGLAEVANNDLNEKSIWENRNSKKKVNPFYICRPSGGSQERD